MTMPRCLALILLSAVLSAAVLPDPVPPGEPTVADLEVTVDGQRIPVVEVRMNRRHPDTYHVAAFAFQGSAVVSVGGAKPPESLLIRPSGYGITPGAADGRQVFILDRPRLLHVEIPGRPPLLVFADGPDADPRPGAATVIDVVADAKADPTGRNPATEAIQGAIDQAGQRGGGVVILPPGLYRSGKLHLRTGVTLHLSPGALLRYLDVASDAMDFTKDHPGLYFINAEGTERTALTGRGRIDGNGERLTGPDGKRRLISAFRSSGCTDLRLEGLLLTNFTSWTVVPAFSRRVTIRDVKIINSLHLYENDGIDPLSCQEVLVDHCFVLATDDAFCPKPGGVGTHGGGAKPGPAIPMRDVVFNDCVAWTRAAGFKLGRQSSTPALNIVAKNSHLLYCHRGCVVDHDGGKAPFLNILFQDITIENFCKSSAFHIETVDAGPTSEVAFERIDLQTKGSVSLGGKEGGGDVRQVRFIDCWVQGQPLKALSGGPIRANVNRWVQDVQVVHRGEGAAPQVMTLTTVWGTHLMSAPAGKPVPVPPAVQVSDRDHRPLPGVAVTFTVVAGGGSIAATRVVTDAKGIASPPSWTLGSEPGPNRLVAAVPGITASQVIFQTEGQNQP